jgi:hypothetical protein
MNVLLLRWDTKPDKRIRRTFLHPATTPRTSFYAATRTERGNRRSSRLVASQAASLAVADARRCRTGGRGQDSTLCSQHSARRQDGPAYVGGSSRSGLMLCHARAGRRRVRRASPTTSAASAAAAAARGPARPSPLLACRWRRPPGSRTAPRPATTSSFGHPSAASKVPNGQPDHDGAHSDLKTAESVVAQAATPSKDSDTISIFA